MLATLHANLDCYHIVVSNIFKLPWFRSVFNCLIPTLLSNNMSSFTICDFGFHCCLSAFSFMVLCECPSRPKLLGDIEQILLLLHHSSRNFSKHLILYSTQPNYLYIAMLFVVIIMIKGLILCCKPTLRSSQNSTDQSSYIWPEWFG